MNVKETCSVGFWLLPHYMGRRALRHLLLVGLALFVLAINPIPEVLAKSSPDDVPDDEAMVDARKVFKGQNLTSEQIATFYATNFYPRKVENYYSGMDVISAPAGSTPGKVSVGWPDQLLDLQQSRPGREKFDPVVTPKQILGRNTWMIWCGGNEAFWDWLANNSVGFMDLLKLLDSRKRATRWRDAGLVNEPGMRQAATTNEYGLWLDRPEDDAQWDYFKHEAAYAFTNSPAQWVARYQNYGQSADKYSKLPPWEIYGFSSGIVGLRLFPNPKFDEAARKKWDGNKYYTDPSYYSDPNLIRPFRVGMSCAFCHASAHPLNPPPDPARPQWENISGNIGSQYLRIRAVFGNLLPPTNFVYHVLDSQPPGTIDTSLIASDNINNPNTMNAIFGVPQRVIRSFQNPKETLPLEIGKMPSLWENPTNAPQAYKNLIPELLDSNGNPRYVPRVLLDGADSVGVWIALARVYLNIGTYSEQWIRLHEPLIGFLPPKAAHTRADRERVQMPFTIKDCKEHSVYWQATQLRVEALRDYFLTITPSMPLLDAEGLEHAGHHVKVSKLEHGRQVFAQNCIVCHSSIQPESNPAIWRATADIADYQIKYGRLIQSRTDGLANGAARGELWDHDPGQWLQNSDYQSWAAEAVEQPDFWRQNFLSTDYRVRVTDVKTNPGRALANNATSGHMWEDFSSVSYRSMPSVGAISFQNPFDHTTNEFTPRHKVFSTNGVPEPGGGGPGFYRPPPLISVWATAPLLHNNSLGLFNNDPSVCGRLEAFDDAIHKLLWPARRLENTNYATAAQLKVDNGLIWRTPVETYVIIPAKHVPAFARRIPWPASLDVLAKLLERIGPGWRLFPSIALLVIGLLLLATSKSRVRLQRFLGYGAFGAAIALGFFILFLGGNLGDLRLGPIPAGTPVDLLANINPDAPRHQLNKAFAETLAGLTEIQTRHLEGEDKAKVFRERIGPALLSVSKCPDFVMDEGHFFPWFCKMTDEDKEALIELLKTF